MKGSLGAAVTGEISGYKPGGFLKGDSLCRALTNTAARRRQGGGSCPWTDTSAGRGRAWDTWRRRGRQQRERSKARLRQGQPSTARNGAGEASNAGLGKDTAPQSAKGREDFPSRRVHGQVLKQHNEIVRVLL